MHQLRGQDGAGRSLPAMPATGEMQSLSPPSGSALLSRNGHLSRVLSQGDQNTRSACRGGGRERNDHSNNISRHFLRALHRGQCELHSPNRRHLPPTIRVCVTLFFFTITINCFTFAYENVFLYVIFASLSLVNERCAIVFLQIDTSTNPGDSIVHSRS